MKCNLCPRNCNTDRLKSVGFCGTGETVISRVGLHAWEEPCISGDKGSGTVFFAGCNLKCRFCQNYGISAAPHGVTVSPERLADVFLYVQDMGAANVNLVTPSHFADNVAKALRLAKPRLNIPVIFNTGAYDKADTIRMLDGLVDVYLPDLKFCSPETSRALAGAPDYFDVATAAITEMRRQQPRDVFNGGYIQNGVIVRYLALPGFVEDGKRILDWISSFDKTAYVSLMSQYFAARRDDKFPQLNRRLYRHEYESLQQYFVNVGLKNGYFQDLSSATVDYLPEFGDSEMEEVLAKVPRRF